MARRWISRAEVYQKGGGFLAPQDAVGVKFVTVIGEAGDFAVYMGTSDRSDDDVAECGDKVPEEVGRAVAPYCGHLYYRR
ncbi:MAG TPA: hypothetical protein VMY98_02260 [Anaerolineae bacterium]|nr:hypothetical protein [Anaerolineae bacterium]